MGSRTTEEDLPLRMCWVTDSMMYRQGRVVADGMLRANHGNLLALHGDAQGGKKVYTHAGAGG